MTGKGRFTAARRRTRRVTGPSWWPSFGQTWGTVSCDTQVRGLCFGDVEEPSECGEDHWVVARGVSRTAHGQPHHSPLEESCGAECLERMMSRKICRDCTWRDSGL